MNYIIENATLVNEGKTSLASVFVKDGIIEKIIPADGRDGACPVSTATDCKDGACPVSTAQNISNYNVIDATGLLLLPGAIDDHVHFREPGLTHKADIASESRAAVAGGVTSFMEMPNTNPPTLTQQLLQDKYDIAAEKSCANYSFYIGVSNNNMDEVLKTDPRRVCGIKVFMGSSTGNMLVDDGDILSTLFKESPCLVAAHCEDDAIIKANTADFESGVLRVKSGVFPHPIIRNVEACYKSSSKAVELATKYGGHLHVMHVTTEKELSLFRNDISLKDKKITAEACLNHLWFSDKDYNRLGNLIKVNPAIKSESDRQALRRALIDGRIDVIGTDHAPHTLEEKMKPYMSAPSGTPSIQHVLPCMIELASQGVLSITKVVELMSHNPATLFNIKRRGFIREGYHADLVLVDPHKPQVISNAGILSKCGWTPYDGVGLHSSITHTFVNGELVYHDGKVIDTVRGMRLEFNR
ncbi:MAG: dihydroorotase [Bacteroidales bacterium]|nr:dihydroorotase [Bacteroidales bacterium]